MDRCKKSESVTAINRDNAEMEMPTYVYDDPTAPKTKTSIQDQGGDTT